MGTEVRVPVQGEGMESCVIAQWYVQRGESVAAGQPMFAIETAKAVYDVPAPVAGIVSEISAAEGDEVEVHQVVATLTGVSANESSFDAEALAKPDVLLSRGAKEEAGARVKASPKARAAAELHDVDLGELSGSGPGGRILFLDVQRRRAQDHRTQTTSGVAASREDSQPDGAEPHSAKPLGTHVVDEPPESSTRRDGGRQATPLIGIRAIVAQRMVAAAAIPTVTLHRSANATRLLEVVTRTRACQDRWGLPRITINAVLCRVVASILPRHPALNAHLCADGLVLHDRVNLGVAVDTPHGLIVTVVHAADEMSLSEMMTTCRDLAVRACDRSITPEEMSGSTFTVTNLGALGVAGFTPLLNLPEVAILGIGAVAPGVVDASTIGKLLPLSLTFDHRAIDGGQAAAFLRDMADAVADIDVVLIA
jgi:pyruvate dehydrogenase E2 component (dihydrolipoamide acetyltransferase)